jgi:hypothetical protein
VGTAREPWERIDGAPRRAAVSSFGYSGTNAHLVIEEYIDNRRSAPRGQAPRGASSLFVLSARTEERLRVQAGRVLDWMRRQDALDVDAFTHTLQVGREAMEHRLACAFDSVAALQATIQAFVDGERHVQGLHLAEVKRHREALAAFTADDDLHGAIDAWIAKGKYDRLLDLWVKGLAVDWARMRQEPAPTRLSLPGYPFAPECHWLGGPVDPVPPIDPPPSAPTPSARTLLLTPRWVPLEAGAPTARAEGERWVLLAGWPAGTEGASLAVHLPAARVEVLDAGEGELDARVTQTGWQLLERVRPARAGGGSGGGAGVPGVERIAEDGAAGAAAAARSGAGGGVAR